MIEGPALSVLFPAQITHPDQLVPFAELVRDGLADRLWAGQSVLVDAHHAFAHLAGRGLGVPVGTSVALTALRHPFEAALQARSVSAITGFPSVSGFGPGEPAIAAALDGVPYRAPVAFARRYAHAVRCLLRGEPVLDNGRGHPITARLPAFGNPLPEIGLGVLRPAMARATGAVADVAITWLAPPGYLADTITPALREGASGRRAPRLVAAVHVAPRGVGRDGPRLAFSATRHHLAAPHYADVLRRAGVTIDLGDPAATGKALIEADAVVHGNADEVTHALRRYRSAGVDEVVLNVAGVLIEEGADVAVRELRRMLESVRELVSAS